MKTFERLAALLLVATAGCTVDIQSRTDAFDIQGGAKLRGDQQIALHNAYQVPTVVTIMRSGQTRWQADLKSLTDTGISMLGRHLSKQGVTIDGGATKKVTLRVHEVTATVAPFANRVFLTLDADLGNGATRSIRIPNTSPEAQRALDGAVVLGLTELLKDEQFLAYVNAY
jgi:hypothetical protein